MLHAKLHAVPALSQVEGPPEDAQRDLLPVVADAQDGRRVVGVLPDVVQERVHRVLPEAELVDLVDVGDGAGGAVPGSYVLQGRVGDRGADDDGVGTVADPDVAAEDVLPEVGALAALIILRFGGGGGGEGHGGGHCVCI